MPTFKYPIRLETSERDYLNLNTKSGNWTPRQVLRAKILLLADVDGPFQYVDTVVAKELGCSLTTIFNTRRRFCTLGSIEDAIFEKPRPGRPNLVDGAIDAHMTKIACSKPPKGRAKWSLRMVKNKLVVLEVIDQISHMTVARALKKKRLNHG